MNNVEFELLKQSCNFTDRGGYYNLCELAKTQNFSEQVVSDTCQLLIKNNLLTNDYKITKKGLEQLKPYKVKNAIIMAAGLSSRFVPLSFDKPKGLSVVKNEILIEREIEQLQEAGIKDIYVIVGYKKELYFYLQDKYGVQLIINNEYATRNNNGSIWLARNYLDNTYICSSDDYFVENPFEQYVYDSYYAVEYMEGQSSERGVKVDDNGKILETYPNAKDAWALMGHVYWNKEFSNAFMDKLSTIYDDEETKPLLWERIFDKFINELPPLYIRKYNKVIYEFDSIEEIKKFDPYFMKNVDSFVFENISKVLKCNISEITDFEVMKAGQTNETCTFKHKGIKYVYRNCSSFTRDIVNREREAEIQALVQSKDIDTTVLYLDPVMGWKISRFVDSEPREFKEIVDDIITSLHKVHSIKSNEVVWKFDFLKEITRIKTLLHSLTRTYDNFENDLYDKIVKLYNYVKEDNWELTLCHNDINAGNFLYDNDKVQLIDWEYAGVNDPAYDIAKLVLKTETKGDEARQIISKYYGRPCTKQEEKHILACGAIEDYYWFIWGIYLEMNGRNLGDEILTWHRHAKEYGEIALKMYEEEHNK